MADLGKMLKFKSYSLHFYYFKIKNMKIGARDMLVLAADMSGNYSKPFFVDVNYR